MPKTLFDVKVDFGKGEPGDPNQTKLPLKSKKTGQRTPVRRNLDLEKAFDQIRARVGLNLFKSFSCSISIK